MKTEKNLFDPSLQVLLAMNAILAVSLTLRLAGTSWDGFTGLHPDERHLLFVSTDMLSRWADQRFASLSFYELWFATGTSPLDLRYGGKTFVYGEMPILVVVIWAKLAGITGWDKIMELGRNLTAVVECSSALAVFMGSYRLSRSSVGAIVAAIFCAAAPAALQQANFFTVDGWLMACTAWSCVAFISLAQTGRMSRAACVGLTVGLALACKLTGALLIFPALFALFIVARDYSYRQASMAAVIALLTAAATFRLLNPFAFAGPGLLGLHFSDGFLKGLEELKNLSTLIDFPPNWQWIAGYSAIEFLRDFALFGCGPLLVIMVLASGVWRKYWTWTAAVPVMVASLFIVQPMTMQASALRYAAPAIPAMALVAGLPVAAMSRMVSGLGGVTALVVLAVWWGSGVVIMHGSDHSRIIASKWLWSKDKGTVLVNETGWDDGLPVPVVLPGETEMLWAESKEHFKFLTFQITDPDTPEKAKRMATMLAEADLVIQSSGRQRDVMPRLAARFPMTRYYYTTLEKELCLRQVFQSGGMYPLPLLPFDDGFVQEPWTVYDHPRVIIYERRSCFDRANTERLLLGALHK